MVVKFGILTVSDRCSRGDSVDESGRVLHEFIKSDFAQGVVAVEDCVPDDIDRIKDVLLRWSDVLELDVILTTGGTGFSPRDVTPEATKLVLDKEAQGLVIAMIQGSLNVTPMAMLSRPQCGIRNNSIIINLPGSPKGALENFKFIYKQLTHAVNLIQSENVKIVEEHKIISGQIKSKIDPHNVAHRPRESLYTAIPVEKAQKIVLNVCNLKEKQMINLKEGYGYILAVDIYSKENIPPFPASIKDGYAVKVSPSMDKLQVLGNSTAGDDPEKCSLMLGDGYCVRISTGAPVPSGADAVIQVEDTKLIAESLDGKEEKEISIKKQPKIGQDIRPIGSDVKKGDKLLDDGNFLGSTEIGILASIGETTFSVYRKPKVAILSTGNELQSPYDKWEYGKIRDSNKTTLQTIFSENNISTIDIGIAKDNPDDLLKKLIQGLEIADVIVSTGGVSMGEKDFLKQVLLVDLNAEIHFGSVLMKPGKPTTFASLTYKGKQKFVFGLPGNPVSSTVTAILFVLPACRKMSGYQNPQNATIKAKVEKRMKLDFIRPEYHRVVLNWSNQTANDGYPIAVSTGNQISSRLASCNSSNALAILPQATQDKENIEAGTLVDTIIISSIRS